MTIKDIIDNIQEVNENPFSNNTLLLWINELEADIQLNIFLFNVENVIVHTAVTESVVADAAHTIIYRLYLNAMIALTRKEYASYQNEYEVFKQEMNNYSAWYADRYHPADGKAETSGYYLTAYSIAVKYGYSGSEADWITQFTTALIAAAALGAGATGTFITADGKTVTVTGGVITAIV